MTIKKKKIVSKCVQNVQVKIYFFNLVFKQKQVILFWKGEKVPIFCLKYFWIKRVIFWRFDLNGWSHHVETFQEQKSGVIKRNLDNKIFVAAAVYCELLYQIANIFHYFPSTDLKYFLSKKNHAQENGSKGLILPIS